MKVNNLVNKELKKLADFVLINPELVQATGGNISYKYSEDYMRIKSSGVKITDILKNKGYVDVNYPKICKYLNEFKNGLLNINDTKKNKTNTPISIEVFFHAILQKVVLHTHPIYLNAILCSQNGKSIIKNIFPSSFFVPYLDPGIDLGIFIQNKIKNDISREGNIFFLENHGLIVSGNCSNDVIKITEQIHKKCKIFISKNKYRFDLISNLKNINSKLKLFPFKNKKISDEINKHQWLCQILATTPDTAIFCGAKPLIINDFTFHKDFLKYVKNFGTYPKVLIYDNKVFALTTSSKISNVIEEVFLSHISILLNSSGKIKTLPIRIIRQLNSRDDEKYRLNLLNDH